MTARTHDLAAITALGAVTLLIFTTKITLGTALFALVANQLGGIAPDIDQPTAPFWRNLPVGGYFGRVIDKMLGGHRFISHSLLGAAGFGFLSWALLKFIHPIIPHTNVTVVWWAFMIGVASHLIMDTFTKEGVPWLLPIPIKLGIPPLKAFRITTGSVVERFVFFGLIGLDAFFIATHYGQLLALIHHQIV
jgi:inner membrane protein